MTTLLTSTLLAGAAAALLISVTHVMFWKWPWRLTRLQAYCVGLAQIGAVLTAWALMMGHPETVIGFWGVAGFAGASDLTAWWLRRRIALAKGAVHDDAFERGKILGIIEAGNDLEAADGTE